MFVQTIQDVCRARKNELKLTAQEIADRSGVNLSTVNNFFASASKLPSFATVGAICAALGVSLDAYLGIRTDDNPDYTALLHKTVRAQKHIIIGLIAVIILLLCYGITLDILNPDMGLFRGGM